MTNAKGEGVGMTINIREAGYSVIRVTIERDKWHWGETGMVCCLNEVTSTKMIMTQAPRENCSWKPESTRFTVFRFVLVVASWLSW